MPPTIIFKKASNWVDRGESPQATVERVLGRFFGRSTTDHAAWLVEHSTIIIGMVEADATEVHVVGYLRALAREIAFPESQVVAIRTTAIALWHVAKAALVRDFAERVLRGEVPVNQPTPDSFSHWMASRLLSPDELARFEHEARGDESDD
ncbi:MAG TPA: hypothetical protein VGN73_00250 [Gemmatimonadaceae bacterium]|jgi:hypothetical protein|nr:hypothetical protein [Gemmatimonadaceae bacterium]